MNEEVDWNAVSWIRSSPSLYETLKVLEEDGPRASCEIHDKLGVKRATVSSYFRRLKEKELIKCFTPKRHKTRLYGLTTKGKRVIEAADPY